MSRVRIVNGSLDTFRRNVVGTAPGDVSQVPPAITREDAAAIAAKAMAPEATLSGCLSDPRGLLQDALGRWTEIPERESTIAKARQLCKEHALTDADNRPVRYQAPGVPDLDIVIVCHPTPQMVAGVDGEQIEVDRWMVFAREMSTVQGTCYACNSAERTGKPAKRHDCWRKKTWLDWVPFMFAWAHGVEDAEDLAKELRSSWETTAQATQQGWDNQGVDWTRQVELPFSTDFVLTELVGKQNAWDSLSRDEVSVEVE